MKAKRTVLDVKDFGGGLRTLPGQTDIDPQFTPDCLNVYVEGDVLRRRNGVLKLNSASAGTRGNGFYNWVQNASQQYLMALWDGTLKQMTLSGNTWSGTWATVSKDSANGTGFSSAIMHFVAYQGTLIMTTENRDKPQRITVTDTSYKNIDFGGSGTAPFAKYPQVWKDHVWLLNCGGGGQLAEDCTTLGSWTTLDIAAGATTTTTFAGQQTFRLRAGAAAGSDAHIKIASNITSISTSYSTEIKTYFATMGNIASGDYAWMDIYNGVVRFRSRWSTDGLEIFDGSAWKKVGVGIVTTGAWITWKFLVTAGTATASFVDVFQNTTVAGLQFSIANASTGSVGQIDLQANAGGSANRMDWYMDYIYINSIAFRTNYYTDGVFNTWVGTTQATYTDNVLPTTPLVHLKLNDNAANTTVANNGSSTNAAQILSGATTINTSAVTTTGKISTAFKFSVTSNHNVSLHTTDVATMRADTGGGIALWINPSADGSIVSFEGAVINSNNLSILTNPGGSFGINLTVGGVTYWGATATYAAYTDGTWKHLALASNGTDGPILYINNAQLTLSYYNTTDKSKWLSTMGTALTKCLFGARAAGGVFDNSWTGYIDDIRYYSGSLNSANLQAIYAEGNGNEGQPTTVQEGTTFYMGTYSYRVNNDGQYAVVSQTLTSSAAIAGLSLNVGVWCFFTNLATYKIRINDDTNNYDSATLTGTGTWQYQTLSFTPVSATTAVRAQVIALSSSTFYLDQVAVVSAASGATQDLSDRLQRSVSGTYDTWTGGNSGTNDITTAGDIGLTGSCILQDRMYVFKSWNIYRVTYTASTPLLDIKLIKSVVGTKSPRTIKNIDIPDKGEVVIFLGSDRNLYMFDGFSNTPLSDIIQLNNGITSVYTNNINTQALDKCFAINHSDLGWYEIFIPIGDAVVPTHSIVFNYRNKAFWPFDNRNYTAGSIGDLGDGQRVAYVCGATDGFTSQLNTGNSDNGTAFNSYWTSTKLGQDYMLGRVDEFSIITDSVNCTPTFGWRANFTTTYTTVTMKANQNKHNFSPETIDNLIQFKISDNSTNATFKIWHMKGLEKVLGIGA